MCRSSVVYCLSFWLTFTCAALAQTEPRLVVASSPEPAVLPAAPTPMAQPVVRPSQPALIKPAIKPRQKPSHAFFDRTNLRLHVGAVAAETADLITTREVLAAGGTENNPVFRPLIRRGVGGQVLVFYGFGEGGGLLTSYLLHRTGHHRLERMVPIATMVVEGLAGASNIRTRNGLVHQTAP